jgi:hypothetical protein
MFVQRRGFLQLLHRQVQAASMDVQVSPRRAHVRVTECSRSRWMTFDDPDHSLDMERFTAIGTSNKPRMLFSRMPTAARIAFGYSRAVGH